MKYVRWLVTILLVGWLLTLIDLGETLRILATARFDLIAVVLLVIMAIRVIMAWRWLYVMRMLGIEARFIEVFRVTMISMTLSLIMPGGHAAVDAYRTWSMSRLRGSMSTIMASVAADRVFGFYSLILMAFIGTLMATDIPGEIDLGAGVAWLFAIATMACLLLVAVGPRLITGSAVLLSWWPKARGAVTQVAQRLQDGNLLRRIAIPSTLLALPVQLLRGIEFYLIYTAVGADVELTLMLIFAPLVFLLMLLPISIGGAGVREASFYLLLAPLGISADAVVATGVLFHLLGIIIGLPGALWISRGPKMTDSVDMNGEPSVGSGQPK